MPQQYDGPLQSIYSYARKDSAAFTRNTAKCTASSAETGGVYGGILEDNYSFAV